MKQPFPIRQFDRAAETGQATRRFGRLLLVPVAAGLFLLLTAACTKLHIISTRAAGHDITVKIEGSHCIEAGPAHAVFSSDFGKVTIEPARVRLEDGPWTKIPEQVPITVGISKHKRWLQAAGVSIKETFN